MIKWIGLSIDPVPAHLEQSLLHQNMRVDWKVNEHELKTDLKNEKGSVVFLIEHESYNMYQLCKEISITHPLASIILFTLKEEIDIKEAMYAGAMDIISSSSTSNELKITIEKAKELTKLKQTVFNADNEIKDARVVTVCSTKGGVGKTTISVNLATAFARKNLKVAIIDLDLQFGDVAILFDAEPKKTIYEWIKESYEQSLDAIADFMTKTEFGVDILAAPTLPEFAELVLGEHVGVAIEKLKPLYDLIIIDTPPSLVETGLVALENSDDILLITSLDLPTLKNGKLAIETLQLLGIKEKMKVILNRDTEMEGMTVVTVENIMGIKVSSRIPSDYPTVVTSLNNGIPFVVSKPKSPVSSGIVQLADLLLNKTEGEKKEEKKNFFKKIFAK